MGTGPRTVVQAPPAAAPRFGLLASIPPTKNVDPHWMTGIEYGPEGCQSGQTFDPCDVPSDVTPDSKPGVVQWDPYPISVSEECSTFSGVEENAARVRRLMNAMTETLIGAEFWDGTQAQAIAGSPNTWLADGSDTNFVELSSSEVGLVHALACLEQYLAENNGGQQGAIHATSQVVTHWESFRLLRREGNMILTFKDTIVIPSPGYTGNSPDGDTGNDNVWAYATDLPRIFLGPVREPVSVEGTIDRVNNTVVFTAQRFALVEWQRCRHAGIQLAVDVCGAY